MSIYFIFVVVMLLACIVFMRLQRGDNPKIPKLSAPGSRGTHIAMAILMAVSCLTLVAYAFNDPSVQPESFFAQWLIIGIFAVIVAFVLNKYRNRK